MRRKARWQKLDNIRLALSRDEARKREQYLAREIGRCNDGIRAINRRSSGRFDLQER